MFAISSSTNALIGEEEMVQFTGKLVLLAKLSVLLLLIIGGLAVTSQSDMSEPFVSSNGLEQGYTKVAVVDVRDL